MYDFTGTVSFVSPLDKSVTVKLDTIVDGYLYALASSDLAANFTIGARVSGTGLGSAGAIIASTLTTLTTPKPVTKKRNLFQRVWDAIRNVNQVEDDMSAELDALTAAVASIVSTATTAVNNLESEASAATELAATKAAIVNLTTQITGADNALQAANADVANVQPAPAPAPGPAQLFRK